MSKNRRLRAALWGALVMTADANRRATGLPTAWVPHGVGNSILLWLPEILSPLQKTLAASAKQQTPAAVLAALHDVVSAPTYAYALAPAVLGYVVSHPQFNIYQGTMGEWNIGGFGLDAIPHSTTAAGLTFMARQGLQALDQRLPEGSPLRPLAEWGAAHPAAMTLLTLTAISLAWEFGEYSIREVELRARDYDYTQINMKWDLRDTIFDLLSNSMGWLLATLIADHAGDALPAHS